MIASMPVIKIETMAAELGSLANSKGLNGAMKLMFYITDALSRNDKPLAGKLHLLPIVQMYHNSFFQNFSEIELCLLLTLVLTWVRKPSQGLGQYVDGEPSVARAHMNSIGKFMAEKALVYPKNFSAAVARVVDKIKEKV